VENGWDEQSKAAQVATRLEEAPSRIHSVHNYLGKSCYASKTVTSNSIMRRRIYIGCSYLWPKYKYL